MISLTKSVGLLIGLLVSSNCLLTTTSSNVVAVETTTKRVLAIGAANHRLNWRSVEKQSSTRNWTVDYLELEGFGATMSKHGFQRAIEESESLLRHTLRTTTPDAILVMSKGLNVLTFVASTGLFHGPAIMLSPIPNFCDHLAGEEEIESIPSWEVEWKSSMQLLKKSFAYQPVAVGVGTSHDEQSLIVQMMEETQVCGDVRRHTDAIFTFEACPLWLVHSFEGDHGWKNDSQNEKGIALLIDYIFAKQPRQGGNDETTDVTASFTPKAA